MTKGLKNILSTSAQALILLAGLTSGRAQAQDASATHASAGLSNFSYRLIDLAPEDGVSPSITFVSPPARPNGQEADGYIWSAGIFHQLSPLPGSEAMRGGFATKAESAFDRATQGQASQWLPSSDIVARSGDGTSVNTIKTNGLQSGITLTSAQVEDSAYGSGIGQTFLVNSGAQGLTSVGYAGVFDYQLGGVGGTVDPDTGEFIQTDPRIQHVPSAANDVLPWTSFVLSPNTSVVFEGDLSAQAYLDVAQLPGRHSEIQRGIASAVAIFEVFRDVPKDGQTIWNTAKEASAAIDLTHAEARASASVGYSESLPVVGHEVSEVASKSFSAELRNDAATSMVGYMQGSAGSSFNAEWVISAVPEPGTYALMGLGLIGISLVARRRQATQA